MPYTLKLTSHNLVIKHTAAVQIVDASDLQANADLQEWPISGSGDVCWLTAVPKLASWQRCCWDLSVLAGHRFDPDPTSLTSWQDFCSEQQCWHRHTIRTNCRQTHTRTLGRLANISSACAMWELLGTVLYTNNRIIVRSCRLARGDEYIVFQHIQATFQ